MLNNTVQQINISPYHFAPDKTGDEVLTECDVLRSVHNAAENMNEQKI